MTHPNIQMRTYEVGFSIDHDLHQLKRDGKITDSHVNTFRNEGKQFVCTFRSHILLRVR